MTVDDIPTIERSLNVTLPEGVRQALLSPSLEEDLDVDRYELFSDATDIVTGTEVYRDEGFFSYPWPAHYLVMGNDLMGNVFLIDLSRRDDAIFIADHESGFSQDSSDLEQIAPSLSAWLATLKTETEEVAAGVERSHQKPWWQFWK